MADIRRLSTVAQQSLPVLERLTRTVSALYDVPVAVKVADVLLEADHLAELRLTAGNHPEEVFVLEEAEGEALGLFLDPATLAALSHIAISGRINLAVLLPAIEGISHVQWLSWRKRYTWPISALELEIQGELDKFFVALILTCQATHELGWRARWLRQLLFGRWRLPEHLAPDLQQRYVLASRFAERMICRIVDDHSTGADPTRFVREARRCARLGLTDKIHFAR